MRELKVALDPANASAPSFCTDPSFKAAMARVEKHLATIVLDD